jgi:hypothetical protein
VICFIILAFITSIKDVCKCSGVNLLQNYFVVNYIKIDEIYCKISFLHQLFDVVYINICFIGLPPVVELIKVGS